MPSNHPLAAAVADAGRRYRRFDNYRDRHMIRAAILDLDAQGYDSTQIAVHVHMEAKQVRRIITGDVSTSQRPEPPSPRNVNPDNCRRLERSADIALDMACTLRDEDPQIVWDTITSLSRTHLEELAVILLAAVPIHQPKSEVFAWVYQIGQQR